MKSMEKEGGTRRNMGIELREEGEKVMTVNAVSWMARKGKIGCQNKVQEKNGRCWCTRTVCSRYLSLPWSRMQSGDTPSCRNVAPATVLVLSLFLAAPNQGWGSGVFAQHEPCPRAPHWAGAKAFSELPLHGDSSYPISLPSPLWWFILYVSLAGL